MSTTEEFLSPKRHAAGYPSTASPRSEAYKTSARSEAYKTNSTSNDDIDDDSTSPTVGTDHKRSGPTYDFARSSPKRDFYRTSGFRSSPSNAYQEDDGSIHSSYKPKTKSTSDTPLKPLKPTMGGLTAEDIPWTGGVPNWDWTGLQDPDAEPESQMLRSKSVKSEPSRAKRIAGLYPEEAFKFKKGKDLDHFLEDLKEAFVEYGMDTIGYRRDPLAPASEKKMVDVLTHYSRLNKFEVKKQDKDWFKKAMDIYDKSNDRSAKTFLLNSLHEDLRYKIKRKIKSEDITFAEGLLIFIEEIRPNTTDNDKALVEKALRLTPANYPGHNVSLYVADVYPKLEQLTTARIWDSMETARLCRMLSQAGGPTNYEYSHSLLTKLNAINSVCPTIRTLTNKERHEKLQDLELSWIEVLECAEREYKNQMTDGFVRWPFACNAHDSKAPPSGFGSANLSQLPAPGSYSKSKGNSYKWAPPTSSDKPHTHVNGTPIYRKVISGKTYEWCKHCTRWCLSHNTATHTFKPNGGPSNRSNGKGNGRTNKHKGGNGRKGRRSKPTNGSTNPDLSAQANFGLVPGIIPDPEFWLASCPTFHDPCPICSDHIFDPATAPSPTWSTLFQDLLTLGGPHLLCLSLMASVYNLLQNSALYYEFLVSLGGYTVSDVLQYLMLVPGILLWVTLLFVSIFSGSISSYLDPDPQPTIPRPARRLYSKQLKSAKSKSGKHLNTLNQRIHKHRSWMHRRSAEHQACSAYRTARNVATPLPLDPFSSDSFVRHFKEEIDKSRRCRRSGWNGWKYQKKKRRWNRNRNCPRRRPRQLDLTDPIFRSGLGNNFQVLQSRIKFDWKFHKKKPGTRVKARPRQLERVKLRPRQLDLSDPIFRSGLGNNFHISQSNINLFSGHSPDNHCISGCPFGCPTHSKSSCTNNCPGCIVFEASQKSNQSDFNASPQSAPSL